MPSLSKTEKGEETMRRITLLIFVCCLLGPLSLTGQTTKYVNSIANVNVFTPKKKVNNKTKEMMPLEASLKVLEKKYDVTFIYKSFLVDGKVIPRKVVRAKDFQTAFAALLNYADLTYKRVGKRSFLLSAATAQLSDALVQETINGTVTDAQTGNTLAGVNISVKGTTIGTFTDADGNYSLDVSSLEDTLRFSYIGYKTKMVPIEGHSVINVALKPTVFSGNQLVVVGYGTQKRKSITGAISSVGAEAIGKVHNGSTVSDRLAGQISGLSFRESEGRPGSSASIAIRNMGPPLYVIDGIVQDAGQFNNISPNNIKSITVLKGPQAAIYGSRAANGVVLVETKSGSLDTPTKVGIDAYYGWQNLTRYTNTVLTSGYKWMKYAAEAHLNETGHTSITPEEIQKWKHPQDQKYPVKYESFNWPEFIFRKNAPQLNVNVHASGGSSKTNYYLSFNRLKQNAVFKQFTFNRTNLRVNVDTRIQNNFKVGVKVSGRIQENKNPGLAGGDDYFQPLISAMSNRPTVHPYANNNPKFLNNTGHTLNNAGLFNFKTSGFYKGTWRVLHTNLHATYDFPLEGLSLKGVFGYYYANKYEVDHEYTYKAYDYDPSTDTYNVSFFNQNPYQDRTQQFIQSKDYQGQLKYDNSFDKHTVGAMIVTEWKKRKGLYNFLHDVPPVNQLDLIKKQTIEDYNDTKNKQARTSFAGRITYNFAQTYFLELSAREDASWKFPPHHRWGFFPAISAGWRLTNEPFFESLVGQNSILSNLKFRISYGKLGDDNIPIGNYAYVPGYNYGGGPYIFDGNAVTLISNRGEPVTNITWYTATDFDAGLDFGLWDGKLSGSLDYFHRKRTGLLGNTYEVVIPNELGYSLPQKNQNSDANLGGELSLKYTDNSGPFSYSIKGNINYARYRNINTFGAKFGNSWDQYRNSLQDRWGEIFWGYKVIGQFKSQKQINNYSVNEDGKGNSTLLPGDLIYKDVNNDGVINQYDVRPIGYKVNNGQPDIYGGLQFSLAWKGIDLNANFSFAGMYSFNRDFEARWPFQNGRNLLKAYLDRWHRKDPRDPNSKWIPGKYPPLRFNDSNHNNYNKNSSYWLVNVRYFRMRTLQVGYTFPQKWTTNLHLQKARIYISAYNLFTIDNAPKFVDPAVNASNSLQYPQSKYINIGVNLNF